MKSRFYTTAEVAAILRVSLGAVRQWVQEGKVPATRVGPRGRYRIPAQAIERLLSAKGGAAA